MLYFAYGSNLLPRRLRERTPSAVAHGIGLLRGHRLCWHMASRDGSGKCDVVVDDRSTVHGVLWRIDLAEKPLLDAAESLGVGYAEKRVQVAVGAATVEAWTYTALRVDPALRPYAWYRDIVVAGARHHGLAHDHVAWLAATAAVDDTDAARVARHRALLDPLPDGPPHPGCTA